MGLLISPAAYLKQSRKIFRDLIQNSSLNFSGELHFVLGNEACDLDSAMSTILYAWFLSQVQPSNRFTHIPIFNIPESMYRLKTETVHLLKKFCITQNDIIFRDSIEFSKFFPVGEDKVKLILVDHHVLPRSDEYLQSFISEVIDHRPKAKTFDTNVEVEIATVGSCVTLIAERIINAIDDKRININEDGLESIISFITGPILLDTVNLQESAGKVTERDFKVIERFWKNSKNPELTKLFQELSDAKYSSEGLTVDDLLLKDAKILESTDGMTKVLFSTLHAVLDDFLQQENVTTSILNRMEAENCKLWIGLAPVEKDTSQNSYKPILTYSENGQLLNKIEQTLILCKEPVLELSTEEDARLNHNYNLHRMYNVKASRKQILPLVQSVIE